MRKPGKLLCITAMGAALAVSLPVSARAGCFSSFGAFFKCVEKAFGGGGGNGGGKDHKTGGGGGGGGTTDGGKSGDGNPPAPGDPPSGGTGGGTTGGDPGGTSGGTSTGGGSSGPPPGMDDLTAQTNQRGDPAAQKASADTTDLVKPNNPLGLPPPPSDSGGLPDDGTGSKDVIATGAVARKLAFDYVTMVKSNEKVKSTAGAVRAANSALDEMLREGPGEAQTGGGGADPSGRGSGGAAAASVRADAASKDFAFKSLMASAKSKIKAKDFRGALEDVNAILRADPTNVPALARRAYILNQLKLYAQAEKDARAAIALDPNNAEAWQQLAWSLLKQKRFKEALEAVNRAIELNPNAVNFAIRAYIHEAMGDHAGAIADLEKAALLDPRYRDKLAIAKQGGKIYDPDEDDEEMGNAVAGALSRLPKWPAAAALLILVALSVGGAVSFRREKIGPSSGPAPTMIAQRPAAPAFQAESGGTVIGKYELGRVIGQGGMGQVFEAKDLSLGRRVAIKKLSEKMSELGPQAKQMMLKEARSVAALHHPAIVDIYEILEQNDDLYLVFEYVSGKTVNQIMAEQGGRLPFDKAVLVLRPVCEALAFAHSQNLVHRDMKPSNIMVTEQGHVKLMDFGVARSLDDAAPVAAPGQQAAAQNQIFARTQTVVGTPSYMSPETGEGIVNKEADVYSLGVTLYEMLTGRLPFGAEATVMDKRAMQFAPASSLAWGVPPAVDDLIRYSLQPDPAQRLKSPAEFLARLEAAGAGFQAPAA